MKIPNKNALSLRSFRACHDICNPLATVFRSVSFSRVAGRAELVCPTRETSIAPSVNLRRGAGVVGQ